MKKIFLPALILLFFISCNEETPSVINDTIDTSIVGKWQVQYSKTITNINPKPEQKPDTLIFNGEPGKPITSYMFSRQENIIEIRNDNKIKVFFINSRGGITITNEYVPYEIREDTLIRRGNNTNNYHKYYIEDNSLVIERIPRENTGWSYTISKYFKLE